MGLQIWIMDNMGGGGLGVIEITMSKMFPYNFFKILKKSFHITYKNQMFAWAHLELVMNNMIKTKIVVIYILFAIKKTCRKRTLFYVGK